MGSDLRKVVGDWEVSDKKEGKVNLGVWKMLINFVGNWVCILLGIFKRLGGNIFLICLVVVLLV